MSARLTLRRRSLPRSLAKASASLTRRPAGEDFAFTLEACPGNMIFIGNGDTAACHHPAYDFNDEAIPHGVPHQGERQRDRTCGLRTTPSVGFEHEHEAKAFLHLHERLR